MNGGGRPPGRINAEMAVGASAIFIGVCALAVSLYEASLMRAEQRSAVLPLLELSRSYYVTDSDDSGNWHLALQAGNVGIGPARVMDFVVTVDGQPQSTWGEAMRVLLGRDINVGYGQSTINGRTIPPDRSVTMFDLVDTQLTAEIIAGFDRLDYEACFCSVFNDCWRASYVDFGQVQPVPECRASEASFRE